MEESNLLSLTKATVTHIQVAGMGDRVCVDLCSLMRPGEGLLVCISFLCNIYVISWLISEASTLIVQILATDWIFCQRFISCSLRMLGVKLHSK